MDFASNYCIIILLLKQTLKTSKGSFQDIASKTDGSQNSNFIDSF